MSRAVHRSEIDVAPVHGPRPSIHTCARQCRTKFTHLCTDAKELCTGLKVPCTALRFFHTCAQVCILIPEPCTAISQPCTGIPEKAVHVYFVVTSAAVCGCNILYIFSQFPVRGLTEHRISYRGPQPKNLEGGVPVTLPITP